jgi:hypothetical protein
MAVVISVSVCNCGEVGPAMGRSLPIGQWPHPDGEFFHDTEVAGPVVARRQHGSNPRGHGSGGRLRDTEEHNAVLCLRAAAENKFAKVLVEGDEQATFCVSPGEHIGVGTAGGSFTNPEHVVAVLTQAEDASFRQVFVGADAHAG